MGGACYGNQGSPTSRSHGKWGAARRRGALGPLPEAGASQGRCELNSRRGVRTDAPGHQAVGPGGERRGGPGLAPLPLAGPWPSSARTPGGRTGRPQGPSWFRASSQLSPPLKIGARLSGYETACIYSDSSHPDSLGDGCSVILEKIIHLSRF